MADQRVLNELIATKDLGFGRYFCSEYYRSFYRDGAWGRGEIRPMEALTIHPGSKVLHYSQEVFEGMKAYRQPNGTIAMFRPEANIARMARSSEMLEMPVFPRDEFLRALRELISKFPHMVPEAPGSLYIRPTMVGLSPFLGVGAAEEYLFYILLCPTGGYFGDVRPDRPSSIRVRVSESRVRAAPGGVGSAKTGGNYAASLSILSKTKKEGFNEVLFLDAIHRRYIEELSGMNVMVVHEGVLKTPPLGDTILAGVTRDTILKMAAKRGIKTSEEPLDIREMIAGAADGSVSEMFACGTAAVVTFIRELSISGKLQSIGRGEPGPVSTLLYRDLVAMQNGHSAADDPSWIVPV